MASVLQLEWREIRPPPPLPSTTLMKTERDREGERRRMSLLMNLMLQVIKGEINAGANAVFVWITARFEWR